MLFRSVKKLNKDIKNLLDESFEFYQFTFSNEGIEDHVFLQGWVEGLEFESIDNGEDVIEMEAE